MKPSDNTVLYVGHTGQTIGTRMNQHRVGKSCIRNNSTYKLIAIHSDISKAKRLQDEKWYIHKLKPLWNVQRRFHWWTSESHQFDHFHGPLGGQ